MNSIVYLKWLCCFSPRTVILKFPPLEYQRRICDNLKGEVHQLISRAGDSFPCSRMSSIVNSSRCLGLCPLVQDTRQHHCEWSTEWSPQTGCKNQGLTVPASFAALCPKRNLGSEFTILPWTIHVLVIKRVFGSYFSFLSYFMKLNNILVDFSEILVAIAWFGGALLAVNQVRKLAAS